MRRRIFLAAPAALLVGAAAAEAEVTIDNFTFTPAELKVAAGTRVTWRNRDDIPHSIVDATQPLSRVVDEILSHVRTPKVRNSN